MATKDWKKETDTSKMILYVNKYNNKFNVDVFYYRFHYKNKWLVKTAITDESLKIKTFKTKSQALKYAKSYMRKH